MPTLDNILRRFRPLAAPPGLAGPAGVPPDRRAALAAELAEVFAAIDDVEDNAERVLAESRSRAEARLAAADAQAAGIASEATHLAAAQRAEAYAARLTTHEDEIREELATAHGEAGRIRSAAPAREPPVAAEVLRRVLNATPE